MYSWDPFREMKRIRREVNQLYKNSFVEGNHPFIGSNDAQTPAERFRLPKCDLREENNSIIANFEIPGANKEDIELNVTTNEIEIKVQRKEAKEIGDQVPEFKTFTNYRNQFYRKIPLMLDLDSGKAEAKYHDGILSVEVPKKTVEDHKKRINIQ